MTACQKIALVPNEMLSEMTELVAFRMRRPADLKTLDEWAGYATDENGETVDASEVVSRLPERWCLSVEL